MTTSFTRRAGYRSPAYAESLATAVRCVELPASGGRLLVRTIGSSGHLDACGTYPVFSCDEPARLSVDVEELDDELVSVTLVADPLTPWDTASLARAFPVMRPLAAHYVIDLDRGGLQPSSHHRRKLRRAAAQNTEIRVEADPVAMAAQWTGLYGVLIEQVGITGFRRFSGEIFERMLAVPGTVLFTAWDGQTLIGADWYFEDGDRIYAHLSAYSQAGYARSVSYPLMDAALRHFAARGGRVLDLGGVPLVAGAGPGLGYFKQGWATRMLPCWLCGRVVDPDRYAELAKDSGPASAAYFPRYRFGEFS